QGTAELARLCRTRTRHRVVRHPDARPAHRRSLAASHQHRGSRHVEKAENRHLIPCAATEGTLECSRLWSEAWVRVSPVTSSITSWSELRVIGGTFSRTDRLRLPRRQCIAV